MVSTGNLTVVFPNILNQIESEVLTVKLYFPKLSVKVPFPEVLKTATASIGLLAEISYTVPLTVT